jgi:hypothetical protein
MSPYFYITVHLQSFVSHLCRQKDNFQGPSLHSATLIICNAILQIQSLPSFLDVRFLTFPFYEETILLEWFQHFEKKGEKIVDKKSVFNYHAEGNLTKMLAEKIVSEHESKGKWCRLWVYLKNGVEERKNRIMCAKKSRDPKHFRLRQVEWCVLCKESCQKKIVRWRFDIFRPKDGGISPWQTAVILMSKWRKGHSVCNNGNICKSSRVRWKLIVRIWRGTFAKSAG